jgi:hypothetical protein
MDSLPETNLPETAQARRRFLKVVGWDSPLPIDFDLSGPGDLDRLKETVERELARLELRISELDRSLDAATRGRHAYRVSKRRRRLALQVTEGTPPPAPGAAADDALPAIRPATEAASGLLDRVLAPGRGVLTIGRARPGGGLEAKLAAHPGTVIRLELGEGKPTVP